MNAVDSTTGTVWDSWDRWMPLEPEPLPSSLGRPSPPKHQCSSTSTCTILLSEIGKYYHAFPKGSFRSCFAPPAIPKLVLHHLDAHPFYWSWTTKAGPNTGKSFAVPTVPTLCPKDSPKAVHWMVSIFHAFKAQLAPQVLDQEMGRVLPAYVKLYQNNMLMHIRAQRAHSWVGKPPLLPPPLAPPPGLLQLSPLNPLVSLWSSVGRSRPCKPRSRPFDYYTRHPHHSPSPHTPHPLSCLPSPPPPLPYHLYPWYRRASPTLTTGGCRPSLTTITAHLLSTISTPPWFPPILSLSRRMCSRFCRWSTRQMSDSWVSTPTVTSVLLFGPLLSWSSWPLSSKRVPPYPLPPTISHWASILPPPPLFFRPVLWFL